MIDDVRRDFAQAMLMATGKSFPLLGIPSSVPRFSQGPLNVWFDAIVFRLGGFSEVSPAIVAGILTAAVVVCLYFFLKEKMKKNLAFVAGLMLALSPSAISQSRMPFYLFAIPGFTLLFLWALTHLKQHKSVFLVVLTFCLLFQWELATIPFVAVLMLAFYRNRIRIFKNIKPILLALVLGLLPQIVFDLTHRCAQLCTFVVWMGYRTVAVSGIDGRHGFVLFSLSFWQQVLVQFENLIGLNIVGVLIVFSILIADFIYRVKTKNLPTLYVYSIFSTLFLFVGLIVHGDPSEAYFPPFLILLPILVSYGLQTVL
jgi:4-amino-4-deoxy-L-arabinose transferase-like glycosyltransferase